MNVTIEDRLDTLSQTLDAVVGALNTRETATSKREPTFTALANPPGPVVHFTKELCDYDFSAVKASRGSDVVEIMETVSRRSFADSKGPTLACLTVRLANGKTPIVKVPFIKGARASAPAASAKAAAAPSSDAGDLETIAAAAFSIEARVSAAGAWQSFCAFNHAKGGKYCANIARPLLAASPFPAGALPHEKAVHLRGLLVTHLGPKVAQVTPAPALPVTAAVQPLTTAAILARHRLEKAIVPKLVDGRWTVPGIGASEQAWIDSPQLQHEFPTPESYAAYARRYGRVAV
jgi:hypothetical protein